MIKQRPQRTDLLPIDQELRKFIQGGGRPEAKTYFDNVLDTTSVLMLGVPVIDKPVSHADDNKISVKRTR